MKILTKELFFDHISVKDVITIDAYHLRINIFEKYCLEKFGTTDVVSELYENWQDILQHYTNWLSKDCLPGTVSNYLHLSGNTFIIWG
jgi:hypothetical protein